MDLHSANIATHVGAGAAALGIGLFALFSRKGGLLHRRAGWVTASLGGVALVTAIMAVLLVHPPAPLVAATLSASYQYLSGLRSARLRWGRLGWPDIGLALAGLALVALLLHLMSSGTRSWSPAIGYSTMGFITIMALYDLSRPAWFRVWQAHVRPLDHGVKMIGFYFAMMSAGAGNLLAQWQPLSQVLPSMLGMITMIAFVVYYSLRPVGRPVRLVS